MATSRAVAVARRVGVALVVLALLAPSGASPTGAVSDPTAGRPVTAPVLPPTPTRTGAVGAVPIGRANYPVPTDALFVSPTGDDAAAGTLAAPLRTVVAARARVAAGQTIVLRAGDYHETVLSEDAKRYTVQNYPGEAVWFDGSVPVTNWARSGAAWVSTGWAAVFNHNAGFFQNSNGAGYINAEHPLAAYPDQLFVDGAQQQQVAAGTTPAAGQFAVDTRAHTLTMGTDPTGRDIRSSDLQRAWVIAGQVTLRGLGVRRYATSMYQQGAVLFGGNGSGSVVQNVVFDDNASQGLTTGQPRITVDHVTAINEGFNGLHGVYMDDSVVSDCLMADNNREQFNVWPSSGDMKFTRSRNLTIIGNDVSTAAVPGIWLDESVVGFTIAGNYAHGPLAEFSIFVELSATGIVAGNTVRNAKRGISTLDSNHVRIYNNLVEGSLLWDIGVVQDGRRAADTSLAGHDPRQPLPDPTNTWLTTDIQIVNNIMCGCGTTAQPSWQVYALDIQSHVPADDFGITLTGNVFGRRLRPEQAVPIGWGQADSKTLTVYLDPATFPPARAGGWQNLLTAGTQSPVDAARTPAGQAIAQPLPADVAAAIGAAAGARQLGPTFTY